MQKYSKKSLIVFLIITFIAISYTLIAFYIHDPLQIWHKPFYRNITYSKNIRESARAMIRDYDFDSFIIGNSLAENTSSKEAENLLSGKFINLSMSGSSVYEKKIILDYIFKRKNIKQVVYYLDTGYVSGTKSTKTYPLESYEFLYNDNPFDDLKIYFADKYFECNLLFKNKEKCIGLPRNMDRPYEWWNEEIFQKRFGGFDKWIENKEQEQIKDVLKRISDTPLDVKNYVKNEKYIIDMQNYLDKYFFSIIERNPNTKFYIIFPPTSDLSLAILIRDNKYTGYKLREGLKYVVQKSAVYKNTEVYAFNDMPNIGYIEQYKDLSHFLPEINTFILKSIAQKEHLLTPDNVDIYIDKVNTKALKTDFEYYYNRVKQLE